ncbi:MAG: hypothetical protein ACO1SX_22340 [Actinomycetota bacterium]
MLEQGSDGEAQLLGTRCIRESTGLVWSLLSLRFSSIPLLGLTLPAEE